MTQSELDREVARATNETVRTISSLGFVPLTIGTRERDRELLIVDGDDVDHRREVTFPVY